MELIIDMIVNSTVNTKQQTTKHKTKRKHCPGKLVWKLKPFIEGFVYCLLISLSFGALSDILLPPFTPISYELIYLCF